MRKTAAIPIYLLMGCALFCGCKTHRANQLRPLFTSPKTDLALGGKGPKTRSAEIRYTGCGGFLIDFAGEMAWIDPFFSNAPISSMGKKFSTDTALVNSYFKKTFGTTADGDGRVRSVLISHAHCDHLSDIPALCKNNFDREKTTIFCSKTGANLLRSFPEILPDTARQIVDLERFFVKQGHKKGIKSEPETSPFIYSPGRRIRFAAIPASHAPHYWFIGKHKLPFIGGEVDAPLAKPPRRSLDFKEGKNFNFAIDLLDENGRPVFRIFSNAGAACDAGVGWPPENFYAEKSCDLLLLCGANFNMAKNYPLQLIERLRPEAVFVGHWEHFFEPIEKLKERPKVVMATNVPKMVRQVEAFSQKEGFPKELILEEPLERPIRFRF